MNKTAGNPCPCEVYILEVLSQSKQERGSEVVGFLIYFQVLEQKNLLTGYWVLKQRLLLRSRDGFAVNRHWETGENRCGEDQESSPVPDRSETSISESRRQLDIQNLGVQWGRAGKRDVLR